MTGASATAAAVYKGEHALLSVADLLQCLVHSNLKNSFFSVDNSGGRDT